MYRHAVRTSDNSWHNLELKEMQVAAQSRLALSQNRHEQGSVHVIVSSKLLAMDSAHVTMSPDFANSPLAVQYKNDWIQMMTLRRWGRGSSTVMQAGRHGVLAQAMHGRVGAVAHIHLRHLHPQAGTWTHALPCPALICKLGQALGPVHDAAVMLPAAYDAARGWGGGRERGKERDAHVCVRAHINTY